MDNQSKLAKSEICQHCAKCCKEFGELVDYDTALRFKLLNTDKIIVEEIQTNNDTTYWKVIYKFPCSKLIKEKDGKYYCELYENTELPRPQMCKSYPEDIPLSLIEIEKKDCPALANFANATFAKQKKTNRCISDFAIAPSKFPR